MKTLIFLETQGSSLKRNSYESITAARSLGTEMVGVIINGNSESINTVSEYGLSKVVNINSIYFFTITF